MLSSTSEMGMESNLLPFFQRSGGRNVVVHHCVSPAFTERMAQGILQFDPETLGECMGRHVFPNGDQKTMLIELVEFMNPKQRDTLPDPLSVGSVVRFELINSLYC